MQLRTRAAGSWGMVLVMDGYTLQPNEALVLKEDGVQHGTGFRTNYNQELILTSLNLVVVKKGTFGNSKGVRVFPINEIKVFNGRAQAVVGKQAQGHPALDVYFVQSNEQFVFRSNDKALLPTWVAKINEVVTGQETPVVMPSSRAEQAAGLVFDTLGAFKARLGPKPEAPVQVNSKCAGCGAAGSGTSGSATTCEYCGTVQHL